MATTSGAAPSFARHRASCNEILPRLYLGDLPTAANKLEMARLGITDMITVETKMLSEHQLADSVKRYLYLNAMDHQRQDLLSHFGATNQFIESALKTPSNKVYVHCVAGISRSATIVLAYLMKTRHWHLQEALAFVVARRGVVDPNAGFVEQLKLFEQMNYTVDLMNPAYRCRVFGSLMLELRVAITTQGIQKLNNGYPMYDAAGKALGLYEKSCILKNHLAHILEQYYNKLKLQQVNQYPHIYNPAEAFKCTKCRTIVFYAPSVIENARNLMATTKNTTTTSNTAAAATRYNPSTATSNQEHQPTQHSVDEQPHKPLKEPPSPITRYLFSPSCNDAASIKVKQCPFIFIEPQPWMNNINQSNNGSLDCYKCRRNLGRYSMTGGENCACSKHTGSEFNIFRVLRKKVEQ